MNGLELRAFVCGHECAPVEKEGRDWASVCGRGIAGGESGGVSFRASGGENIRNGSSLLGECQDRLLDSEYMIRTAGLGSNGREGSRAGSNEFVIVADIRTKVQRPTVKAGCGALRHQAAGTYTKYLRNGVCFGYGTNQHCD